MRKLITILLVALPLVASAQDNTDNTDNTDKSLLFYLSGESLSADKCFNQASPNIVDRVSTIPDGVAGKAVSAHFRNAYSYLAPGNIWSERGSIAFWWRSGAPVSDTEFPIWRVSYYDHTSWDMVWMRIDWNGHGLDAFVTDNNLARVRVSTTTAKPAEDEWIHIAFNWDESKGVELFLNGEMIASKDSVVTLRTGLDQFGPHQRIVSPYQVQSAYIIQRGGDIDELRIYDHPLSGDEIKAICALDYKPVSPDKGFDAQGWRRYFGFDKSLPPYLESESTLVRKVQINDCYDYKRWFWKATDGLLETTWPGVYNRSRIAGRTDYFILPDWDCYSFSGKEVTFVAEEDWNYAEIVGGAYGVLSADDFSARKEEATQRAFIKTPSTHSPCDILYTNDVQETPIQEFNLFNISTGDIKDGVKTLSYALSSFDSCCNRELEELASEIDSRYRDGERTKILATSWVPEAGKISAASSATGSAAPVVHIVIPSDCKELDIRRPLVEEGSGEQDPGVEGKFSTWSQSSSNFTEMSWEMLHAGLDAIRISLPAMALEPEKDGLFPLNVAVMDPISPHRYMFDCSFSVKPGEARTVTLDLRDRILPEGKPLYIRISGANASFSAASLHGGRIDLIFKDYDLAVKEHVQDRFNQLRDNWGTLTEEGTVSRRHSKFRQWEGDLKDLLRVDPTNKLALQYKSFCYKDTEVEYEEPQAPANIPEWAFLQLEWIKRWKYLAEWYLDNRQAPNGEFGGGLSDDTTLTELYPGLSEMGVMAERSTDAVFRNLQAIYDNGMLTGGISTIMTDSFHSFEEGGMSITQAFVCKPDDPLLRERLIEASHNSEKAYFGVNEKGHLHSNSDYHGAFRVSMEEPWVWGTLRGGARHTSIPGIAALWYGDEASKDLYLRFWDSMLAHSRPAANGKGLEIPSEINLLTDEGRIYKKALFIYALYAWKLSRKKEYFDFCESLSGTPKTTEQLVSEYRKDIKQMAINEYYNTLGSPYTDRVKNPKFDLAAQRLGGPLGTSRLSMPWNLVAWRWVEEADAEKVAINMNYDLLEDDWFDVEFFNTSGHTVKVTVLPRRASNGVWEISDGRKTRQVEMTSGKGAELSIPAGRSYSLKFKLR